MKRTYICDKDGNRLKCEECERRLGVYKCLDTGCLCILCRPCAISHFDHDPREAVRKIERMFKAAAKSTTKKGTKVP